MSEIKPTRRTVIRTAAWTVPAVSLAAAAPAFAASPGDPVVEYQTVNASFAFHPTFLGAPLTNIDILVDVEARLPLVVPAGLTADPATTVSTVTIPNSLLGIIGPNLGNPAEIGGTSVSTSRLSAPLSVDSVTNLTIDRAPFPDSGDIVTVARGVGESSLPVPAGLSGAVTIELLPPNSTLVGYDAAGVESGTYASALAPKAGVDYTLATFQIV